MKNRFMKFFAILLAFCMILPTAAMAAESTPTPTVRVNGYAVEFPDAKPYYDENSRIMIPVRFVSEELGATVTWNDKTQTATISKDHVSIDVPIGSNTITVTEYGAGATVQMDTTAVLKDGRTYVPIRYVAEALGAYVDYADAFRTVGIYSDVLTAEEIEELRSYPYTHPATYTTCEEAKSSYDADAFEYHFGKLNSYIDSFTNFANAHEYLYSIVTHSAKYTFDSVGTTLYQATTSEFYDTLAREAAAKIAYSSERVTVEFRTDTSCIYQADCHASITQAVRGIVTAKLHVHALDLTNEELSMLTRLGFKERPTGVTLSHPIDVHMNTMSGYKININNVVVLNNDN